MRVIQPSCSLPSENSPGCGCAANQKAAGGKAASAAAMIALAAAACTACCLLPFTLPAVIFASAGGFVAMLDHAHVWVTRLAVLVVICAWLWIGWQVRKTQRSATRFTIVTMAKRHALHHCHDGPRNGVDSGRGILAGVRTHRLQRLGYRKEARGLA